MSPRPIFLTAEGKRKLEEELDRLAFQRRALLERIQEEREVGSFGDSAEPDSDRIDLSFVEGRIQTIELQLRTAQIISEEHDHNIVGLGSSVEVEDEDGERDSYMIVGTPEADPLHGKISNESPVGHALIGMKVGDVAEVVTPNGVVRFTIRSID
jgi:transcription elongation factor GreA